MEFEEAIKHVLSSEGGYTDDPNDVGNWSDGKLKGTKFGISARAYPDLDIKNLTREEAVRIYKRDYWDKFNVEVLPVKIRLHFFDVCVNSGYSRAVKLLQSSLGLVVDGIIGNKTKAKLPEVSIEKYAQARSDFYISLAINKGSNFTFLKGWLRRVISVTVISIEHD